MYKITEKTMVKLWFFFNLWVKMKTNGVNV